MRLLFIHKAVHFYSGLILGHFTVSPLMHKEPQARERGREEEERERGKEGGSETCVTHFVLLSRLRAKSAQNPCAYADAVSCSNRLLNKQLSVGQSRNKQLLQLECECLIHTCRGSPIFYFFFATRDLLNSLQNHPQIPLLNLLSKG